MSSPSTAQSSSTSNPSGSAQNNGDPSSGPESFTLFPTLIPELRTQVYGAAIVSRFIIFRYDPTRNIHIAAPIITVPNLLRASKEAQIEGLKHYIEISAIPGHPNSPIRLLLAPEHDTVMAFRWNAGAQMNSSSPAALRAAVELGGFKKLAVDRGDLIWLSRHLDVWRRLCVTAPELEMIVIVWQNSHRFAERIGVAVDGEGGANHQIVPWGDRDDFVALVEANGLRNGRGELPKFVFGHVELEANL
ncbi:hypothetical protein DL98DRAFT_581569 [Cadophora sp. DSE1049]|nr:hypothetical protein DL98DRAFT_581569 [Cadophora sp. DSE1049]